MIILPSMYRAELHSKLAAKTKILASLIMKLRLVCGTSSMCHVILICCRRQFNSSHLMSLRLRTISPLRLPFSKITKICFSLLSRVRARKKKEIMIYLMSIPSDGKFTSTEKENPMHKLRMAPDQFLSFRLCSTDISATLYVREDLKII